ncbi:MULTISPECIES: right-handed parallel beta-helix repeat-containing protein [Haloferacaceae]|uniref:Right-handed parallel beta-helix repeat-containing protein n=1 Tax=Halorubrum glutamatedens TaxID=2707018 RepID=A0ABD5QVY2_9EURY|nr:right-handed parallel beta-helix repeat-containing protein [Halobellus captivus]
MFEPFTVDSSRREVLKASAIGVGASVGLVGTASSAGDTVEFDETITITPDDSGTTFVQTADFDGRVRIRPGVENVTVDGNGYTITGGGVGGGSYLGAVITDLTLRNLHLPDGSVGVDELDGLVLRNNVIQGFESESAFGVRAVDNTVAGLIRLFENQSENVFARNVAAGIRFDDDLMGSHRLSNNFVLGRTRGPGIQVAVTNSFDGRIRFVDNYVTNADGAGIYLEDTHDLKPVLSGNVIIGNGSHGLSTDSRVASVSGNTFVGNGGDGVNASVGTFTKNAAMSNDGIGFDIRIDRDCLRNVAVSNGGGGFRVESDGSKVKFNRATGNDAGGVVLDGSGFPFRKNNVTANGGDGLVIAADDSGITRNYVCGNDGEQLVDGGDDNRFANNLVC